MIGIFDPLGKELNPLTDEKYSDKYKELAEKWSKLPAYDKRNEIINSLSSSNVILVVSGTGSGKTVLLPKFLLHYFNYEKNIIVTLPKRNITKSSAEYAAATLDVKLGKEVGYMYKNAPKKSRSEKTKLLYSTDGSIIAMLKKDIMLEKYNGIIIDEVHERKVNIDLLMLLLKKTLKLRKDFKVILMSATIDTKIFAKYYKNNKFEILELSGTSNYPIKSIYLKEPLKNYNDIFPKTDDVLQKIFKDEKNNDNLAIIMFVSSVAETEKICLNVNNKYSKVFCIEAHAKMSNEQEKLMKDPEYYKTQGDYNVKLVISTNANESSLTIDGVKYVIDTGYELSNRFDSKKRIEYLERKYISNAQVKQRMGRTGRTIPGIVYHLYTENTRDMFDEYPDSEIMTKDLTDISLTLMNVVSNKKELYKLYNDMITTPDKKMIENSIAYLEKHNLIDDKLTPLGEYVGKYNYTIILSLMLVYGKIYNCYHELFKLVNILANVNKIEDLMIDKKKINKHLKYVKQSGDHLTLLNIYDKFEQTKIKDKKNNKLVAWCEKNNLNMSLLLKINREIWKNKPKYNKIEIDIEKIKNLINYDDTIVRKKLLNRLLFCIVNSLKHNIAIKIENSSEYKTQWVKKTNLTKHSYLKLKANKFSMVVYTYHIDILGNKFINFLTKITNNELKYVKDVLKKK